MRGETNNPLAQHLVKGEAMRRPDRFVMFIAGLLVVAGLAHVTPAAPPQDSRGVIETIKAETEILAIHHEGALIVTTRGRISH